MKLADPARLAERAEHESMRLCAFSICRICTPRCTTPMHHDVLTYLLRKHVN